MGGVDPSDRTRTPHEIDSLDMWPLLTGQTTSNPRLYLPLSAGAIIKGGQFKLITEASASVHYTPNNARIPSKLACTNKAPCLFDLHADPSETKNIYSDNRNLAKELSRQLATYKQYT